MGKLCFQMLTRKLRWVTVEPVLFFYMLGLFLLFGVFQNMVYQKVCMENMAKAPEGLSTCGASLHKEENKHLLDAVQAQASSWIRASTACMVIPSILVDCYMGSWSDKLGRRVTLTLPPVGAFLGNIVYCLMAAYPFMGVRWILLASTLQGVFGSFTSLLTGVSAYIGAVSAPNERTTRFSVLLSMSVLAGTTGPFLSGIMATNVSHLFVFLVIGTCYVIAAVYAAAYVKEPEQLLKCQMANNCVATDEKATEKRHWKCSQLFSLSHLSESFKVCFVDRSKEERVRLTVLFIMAMIVIIVTSGELDIAFLYLSDKPLETPLTIFSYWFGCKYGLASLSLLVVLPVLKTTTSISDTTACALGLISKIAALCLLGLSRERFMIFIEVVIGCFFTFTNASIRSMMSQCVEEKQQGRLFGLFAVFEDVSSLCGSLVFNTLYPVTRRLYNGTMFLAAAALLTVPLVLAVVFLNSASKSYCLQSKTSLEQQQTTTTATTTEVFSSSSSLEGLNEKQETSATTPQ